MSTATPITTLIAGVKEKCGAFLSTHTELDYGIDISQNRSKQARKGYAVLPESSNEDESIGALVIDQKVRIKLTDVFNPGKTNDLAIQAITNSLYDNVFGLYEFLVNNKCGAISLVMNTYGLSVESPEYLDEGVVAIEFTFTIKYRR